MSTNNNGASGVKRVAIYCRVSTDRQASKEDSSLDTQRDRLLHYIEDKQRLGQNWQLACEFIEGEEQDGKRRGKSAKNLNRPAFIRLMDHVQRRLVDVVLFTKIDRISRSVLDFLTLVEQFERYGVSLVSLKEDINTGSAAGRVMTTIMIALAQFEREQTSERTREKMAWRAGKGLPIGPPPLGYRMHEKHYRVVPEEAAAVRFMEEAYLDTRSLDKVARMAFEKGIRSRKDRVLSKDAIGRILRNPIYVGLISHKGREFTGQHEAIRDPAVQQQILRHLDRNWHHKGNGTCKAKKYDYLLQALVVCGHCKGRMVPKSGVGRGGKPYHYYVCCRADKTVGIDCQRNFLPAVEADQHVLDYVKKLALREDLVKALCDDRESQFTEALDKLRVEREGVKVRLAENKRQATNLAKAIAQMSEEPPAAMLEVARGHERERRELEASLARIGEEITRLEGAVMRVDRACKTVRCLGEILDHPRVRPDHVKDLLPKFINYLVWQKDPQTRSGRFELALFERPFRAEDGRSLQDIVGDLKEEGSAAGGGLGEGPPGAGVDSGARGSPLSPVWRG